MSDTKDIETEVIAAFTGLVDASKALDAGRYLEYIDRERFTGLNADGKVWHGFEDLEQLITTGFRMLEKIVSLEFSNVKVTVIDPSTAILVNEYKQTLLLKGGGAIEQAGGGMQVWTRSGDGWKLIGIAASDASQREEAVF